MSASQFIAVVIAVLAVVSLGCRPVAPPLPDQSSGQPPAASGIELPPREDLRRVFGRYRTAAAYRDEAVATVQAVSPDKNGRPRTERRTAPIRVAYRAGSSLTIDAYDVRLRCQAVRTDGRTRFWQQTVRWLDAADRNVADPRRWQAAADQAISLDEVLADQTVADAVAGGPAGPPPQMEWLLAADPMATLFDQQTQFTSLPAKSIDGRPHRRIAAVTAGRRYTFWIDNATGVIGRVELPVPSIPQVSADDPVIESLTLEINGATFSPANAP